MCGKNTQSLLENGLRKFGVRRRMTPVAKRLWWRKGFGRKGFGGEKTLVAKRLWWPTSPEVNRKRYINTIIKDVRKICTTFKKPLRLLFTKWLRSLTSETCSLSLKVRALNAHALAPYSAEGNRYPRPSLWGTASYTAIGVCSFHA